MPQNKRILVVIPAKNEEKLLKYAVNSLLRQKLNKKIELNLILVDDFSSDSTYNIMKEFSRKHNNIHAIKIKRKGEYDPNFGAVTAIKVGVSYARKLGIEWDYLLLLDADTILDEHYIACLISVLSSKKEICIAGGLATNESQDIFHIRGSGMMTRRDVWEKVGGYRFFPTPDTLYQLCLIAEGCKGAIIPTAKLYILRPTASINFHKRCQIMGVSDGIYCTSIWHRVLRAVTFVIRRKSLKCAIMYFVSSIKPLYKITDPDLNYKVCYSRKIVEYWRLKKRISRVFSKILKI